MELFRLILSIVLAGVLAYLVGSINFAIIVSKLFAQKDIRDYGSGNAGMTNVLRTFGKLPAVITTVGDFLKGIIAMLLGRWIISVIGGGEALFYVDYLLALSALLGHCFPVFYRFKGGKGILVSAGTILMLNPIIFLVILIVFGIVVAISKIVSLASISAAVAFPIATWIYGLIVCDGMVWFDTSSALLIAGIVVFMHRSNIKRLLNGTENKFGKKK